MTRIPVKDRILEKNQIRVDTRQIMKEFTRLQEKTGEAPSMRTVAFAFIPAGYRWFENGEDWRLAFWLTRTLEVARERGRHVIGIYTFGKQGTC